MDYIRFGSTGMKVSRICLGCMSYGGPHERWKWALDEEHSRPFIRRALELGINFFDTANVYSLGMSEDVVGRALRDFATRDEVVIATKVFSEMGPGPNDRGLSRKHILSSIDASLKRLGTDYVDLYQIHRWDDETPIEETLEALNDVVRAGKARYIGASSMYAWQFAKALYTSDLHGWSALCLHAEPLQPGLPGGGARNAAALPGPEDRRHPLVAAGARAADPQTDKRARRDRCAPRPTPLARACTPRKIMPIAQLVSDVAEQRGAAHGADRPGLDAFQTVCHLPDHRRDQTAPPG